MSNQKDYSKWLHLIGQIIVGALSEKGLTMMQHDGYILVRNNMIEQIADAELDSNNMPSWLDEHPILFQPLYEHFVVSEGMDTGKAKIMSNIMVGFTGYFEGNSYTWLPSCQDKTMYDDIVAEYQIVCHNVRVDHPFAVRKFKVVAS